MIIYLTIRAVAVDPNWSFLFVVVPPSRCWAGLGCFDLVWAAGLSCFEFGRCLPHVLAGSNCVFRCFKRGGAGFRLVWDDLNMFGLLWLPMGSS